MNGEDLKKYIIIQVTNFNEVDSRFLLQLCTFIKKYLKEKGRR